MKIAIVGLGKMGHQFVVRLIEDGHEVFGIDRDPALVESASSAGAITFSTRGEIIDKFVGSTIAIWLMIPASAVDDEIEAWKTILPQQSILIDGGNSDFKSSMERAKHLEEAGIHFVDVGTSGGILGLENGFSMMVGGNEDAVKKIEPILTSLAKPKGAFHYFGSSGSGHYIKMVHNAIEYGVMESLAEGYEMLKEGPYKELDLSAVAEVWQHGSIIESSLNSLAKDIFSENPNMDGIEGVVVESGEARWTLDLAKEMNVSLPAVQAAFDVRIASENGKVSYATKFLAVLRNKFGGHATNPKQ